MKELYNLNVWNSSKGSIEEYLNCFGKVKELGHKFLKVDENVTDLVLTYEREGGKYESKLRLPYDVEHEEDYKVILYVQDKCSVPFKTEFKG